MDQNREPELFLHLPQVHASNARRAPVFETGGDLHPAKSYKCSPKNTIDRGWVLPPSPGCLTGHQRPLGRGVFELSAFGDILL